MKIVMKKSLIMALAVMMTFVFSFSTSFAKSDKPELNYVAIGSSTANGYGFDGYDKTAQMGFGASVDWREKEVVPYTVQFVKELQNNYNVNVKFSNLCIEGMRTNELRALLDESYRVKFYKPETKDGDASMTQHLNWWIDGAILCNKTTDSITSLTNLFEEKLKKADVITLDVCENNFGTYLANRLIAVMNYNDKNMGLTIYGSYDNTGNGYSLDGDMKQVNGSMGYYNQSINDFDEIPANVKKIASKANETALSLLGAYNSQLANNKTIELLVDSLEYCAMASCINLSADIDKIYELNDDAKIVVFGITNPLKNTWISLEEGKEPINIGDLTQIYVDAVNTYIRALDKNSNKYMFANCTECETFYEAARNVAPAQIDNAFDYVDQKYRPSISKIQTNEGTKIAPLNVLTLLSDTTDLGSILSSGVGVGSFLKARFLEAQGIGSHPSKLGHEQKFEALKTAYENGISSREVVFNEIKAELDKQLKAKIDELDLENVTLGDIDEYIDSLSVYKENETEVKSAVALVCEKLDEFREYAVEGTELDKALKSLTPNYVKTLTVKDVKGIDKTLAAAIKADAKAANAYAEETLCLGKDLTALIDKAETLPEIVLNWTKEYFENTLNTAWAAIETIGEVAFEDTKDVANYVLDNSKEFADYLLKNEEVGQKIEEFDVDPAKVFDIVDWLVDLSNLCNDENYEEAFDMVYNEILKGYEYIKENKGEEIEAKVDEVKTEATSIYEAVYEQAMEDVKDLVDSIWDIATTKDEITPSQIEAVINAISTIGVTETLNVLYEKCPEKIKNCELIEMYRDTLNTVWDEGQKVYKALNDDIQNVYEGVSGEFADSVNAGKAAAIAVYKLVEASYADVAEKETLDKAAMVALNKANSELAKLTDGDYTILHNLTYVAYLAPTTEKEGHNAYYECTKCHKLFKDASGKTETTLKAETIPTITIPPYIPPYNPGNPTVTPVTPAEDKTAVEEEKTLVEKKAEAKAELNSAIADNGFKAKSAKQTKLNGKKALKISWTKVKGADGYEVFRSTKKNSGYGTKPYFSTTKTSYTNNKNLKTGKTYYYKVRAYKLVEGQKVYSDWSLKAWRKIK